MIYDALEMSYRPEAEAACSRAAILAGFILAVIFAAIIVAAIDRRPYWRR